MRLFRLLSYSSKILAQGASGTFRKRKAGKTDYSQALADSQGWTKAFGFILQAMEEQ